MAQLASRGGSICTHSALDFRHEPGEKPCAGPVRLDGRRIPLITLKRATGADAHRLTDLYVDFYAEDAIDVPRERVAENVAFMAEDDRAVIWIAERNGEPVGMSSEHNIHTHTLEEKKKKNHKRTNLKPINNYLP